MLERRYFDIPKQIRAIEGSSTPQIEAYFSVFDEEYDMGYGMHERIDRHAFDAELHADVRALINHDTSLVIGRTTAGTLGLSVDDHGLKGTIDINPNDRAAMDSYERVKRGDVSGCSFGFIIIDEKTEQKGNGDLLVTVLRVKLFEVSVCTFPAYKSTMAQAREDNKNYARDMWAKRMKERLNKWH